MDTVEDEYKIINLNVQGRRRSRKKNCCRILGIVFATSLIGILGLALTLVLSDGGDVDPLENGNRINMCSKCENKCTNDLVLLMISMAGIVEPINYKQCCKRLKVSGIRHNMSHYEKLMGEYSIWPKLPWIEYDSRKYGKELGKRYPVYNHTFPFTPTPYKTIPPRSFLYYYINDIPEYPERQCKERGCWMIGKFQN